MNEDLTEKETVKAALTLLRESEVSYTNDSIYGAAILLESYFDNSLEDALNEFLANSEVEIKVKEK